MRKGQAVEKVPAIVGDTVLAFVRGLVRRHPGSTLRELAEAGAQGSLLPQDEAARIDAVRQALHELVDLGAIGIDARYAGRRPSGEEPDWHYWYLLPLDQYPRGVGKSSLTTDELLALEKK